MSSKRYHETIKQKQERLKEEAILNAGVFYHYELICRSSGIHENTLKKYRDEDPEFSERLEKARATFLARHMKRAKPEFILERLEKSLFKESKELEVTLPTPILDIPDVHKNDSNK